MAVDGKEENMNLACKFGWHNWLVVESDSVCEKYATYLKQKKILPWFIFAYLAFIALWLLVIFGVAYMPALGDGPSGVAQYIAWYLFKGVLGATGCFFASVITVGPYCEYEEKTLRRSLPDKERIVENKICRRCNKLHFGILDYEKKLALLEQEATLVAHKAEQEKRRQAAEAVAEEKEQQEQDEKLKKTFEAYKRLRKAATT